MKSVGWRYSRMVMVTAVSIRRLSHPRRWVGWNVPLDIRLFAWGPKAAGGVKEGEVMCVGATGIVYRQVLEIGNGEFLIGGGDWRGKQWRCL